MEKEKGGALGRHGRLKRAQEIVRERTFVLIKPDGLMRGLVGEIIGRFERVGLKIIALRQFSQVEARRRAEAHVSVSQEWYETVGERNLAEYARSGVDPIALHGTADPLEIGRQVRTVLVEYLGMGPVVALVLEGPRAVTVVRRLLGATLPEQALPGTIRGDFGIDSVELANLLGLGCKNLVHASNPVEEVAREIAVWFGPEDLCEWCRPDETLWLGAVVRKPHSV